MQIYSVSFIIPGFFQVGKAAFWAVLKIKKEVFFCLHLVIFFNALLFFLLTIAANVSSISMKCTRVRIAIWCLLQLSGFSESL